MRRWVEAIVNSQGAYEDFIRWSRETENRLNINMKRMLLESNTIEATKYAAELEAYQLVVRTLMGEYNEHKKQTERKI